MQTEDVNTTSGVQSAAARNTQNRELLRHLDIETATNLLLRIALADISLTSVLNKALDLLMSISWLSLREKGSVFIVEGAPPQLKMVAARGLPDDVMARCMTVPFGSCMCGMAAEKCEIQFCDHVDERHTRAEEEEHHGHYCVPIASRGRALGVLNVYVRPGHRRSATEEEFLHAFADTIALVIERRNSKRQLHDSEAQLQAIVSSFEGLLYVCSEQRVVEYMNEKFTAMLDRDPVGELCHRAIYEREEPCPWCVNERVFAGETVHSDMRLPYDGHYYHVINRGISHADGTGSKIMMATDITARKHAEDHLKETVERLEGALEGAVRALGRTAGQRDPYTAAHQQRVARLACAIAREMEVTEEQVQSIRIAALLHDIGKVAIPAEILTKPGALTPMEIDLIRTHPTIGYELLAEVPFSSPIADIVLQHHERLDGSGYPNGLTEPDLRLESRIVGVADVVEAMASHRPYRPKRGVKRALKEIQDQSGKLFDPQVVDICVRIMTDGTFDFSDQSAFRSRVVPPPPASAP